MLTGIQPSKPVFAPGYRPIGSLDDILHSLDRITDILVSSEDVPKQLCREIVSAAADYLGARWVFLALRHGAMPHAAPRLVALDPGGRIVLDARRLPAPVRDRLQQTPACAGSLVRRDFPPLLVGRTVGGVLGAFQGRAADRPTVAETELSVLRILVNQPVMALQCRQASRRNGQFRERLKGPSDPADAATLAALTERSRELRDAQQSLQTGRQQVIDDERRRLARELHESVAQHVLAAARSAIEWCRTELLAGSPVYERLRRVVRKNVPGLGGGYHHRGLADVAGRVRERGGELAVERSRLSGVAVDVMLPLASVRAGNTAAPPGGNDG